jgi:hypothetical protein
MNCEDASMITGKNNVTGAKSSNAHYAFLRLGGKRFSAALNLFFLPSVTVDDRHHGPNWGEG